MKWRLDEVAQPAPAVHHLEGVDQTAVTWPGNVNLGGHGLEPALFDLSSLLVRERTGRLACG